MNKKKRTRMNECYSCKYRRTIPGDSHIQCGNPDPKMKEVVHGIRSGWFIYPFNFDPVWKLKDCNNYEE